MEEGRKEKLDFAKIDKIARKRAIRWTMFLVVFEIIMLLIMGATSGWYSIRELILIGIPTVIIDIGGFLVLRQNYRMEELDKRKRNVVEKLIPISTYTEVIPTEENDNKELLQRIRKIAKIYAVRNERNQTVEIAIKFDEEEEMYHFKTVTNSTFVNNYCKTEGNE